MRSIMRASLLCVLLLAVLLHSTSATERRRQRPGLNLATPSPSSSPSPPSWTPHSIASSPAPLPLSSPLHPSHGTVNNLHLDPAVDCALRSFAIEVVTALQPSTAWANWTALTQSAFQMGQCNVTIEPQPSPTAAFASRPTPARAEQVGLNECEVEVFVDADQGEDSNDGSESTPFASLPHALTRLRTLRSPTTPACITLRGGRHYLGALAPSSPRSRDGGLHLTPADSNLILRPYGSEAVTLSGGFPLPALNWTEYTKTAAGSVMQAKIPANYPLPSTFNELYIDGVAAVRAKYPNGNPYFHGLYSDPSGYIESAASWLPRKSFPPSIPIHIADPNRNGTVFRYYDLGVEGGASVFDPPTNFWSVANPNAGGNYGVPSGLVVNSDLLPRLKGWASAPNALVHGFHSGYWGSWIFDVEAVNVTSGAIMFGAGGFQEARGSGGGGQWYISNVLAELDEPNEWYIDMPSRTLYFMPNKTMPTLLVGAQTGSVMSLIGAKSSPLKNVIIKGFTLTETSNTFMAAYEAPASGDWAIHRGGAVFIEGTENIRFEGNLITQVATNGLVISNWNNNVTVDSNEFVWLGDSAIIIVGSSALIDGVGCSDQPDNITVSRNLIHETGAYVKQSAPTFVALSRQVLIDGNVAFNVPRSAVNINDGFAGNKTISHNVFFNAVRETSDHGPINTWDRQPYLTTQGGNGASLIPHQSYIHHNALFNNYNSFYPIDHDDGSCYYLDSYNVQFYGAKKNYLGHSKIDRFELYIYPDTKDAQGPGVCIADQAPTRGSSGFDEEWTNNTCVMYNTGSVYNIWSCETTDLFTPYLADNKFYIPAGFNVSFGCNVKGQGQMLNLTAWQALGEDKGSKAYVAPEVSTIIEWGREMLLPKSRAQQ